MLRILSFLSFSRKVSIVTIQNLKVKIRELYDEISIENDSSYKEKSCFDNKKRRKKNKKKKKKNQESLLIVKIQAIFRKKRQRDVYQRILMYIKIVQAKCRRLIYQQRYHHIKKSVLLIQKEVPFRVIYRNFCLVKKKIVSHVQKTQFELAFLRENKYNLDFLKSKFMELTQLKYELLMVCFKGLIYSLNPKNWIQRCDVMIQERHQNKRNFIMKHQILMIDPTQEEHIISKCIQECTDMVNCLRKSNSKSKKINLKIDIQNNKMIVEKHKLLLKYHYLQ